MTRWERFKKWVDNHEEELVKWSYYSAGAIISSVVMAHMANKRIDAWKTYAKGIEVCCGGMREGSNGTIFDVYLKNDHVIEFKEPFAIKPQI